MNLYFRFIWLFIKCYFNKTQKQSVLETASMQFRVLPTDCDLNLHLTNARYMSFMDLGRTYFMGELGILKKVLGRGWAPIICASDVVFLRPINPFQKFTLTTRMLTWDEKYGYFEHRFLVGEKTHAVALVKGLFLKGKTAVPPQKAMSLTGEDIQAPMSPANVDRWREFLAIEK